MSKLLFKIFFPNFFPEILFLNFFSQLFFLNFFSKFISNFKSNFFLTALLSMPPRLRDKTDSMYLCYDKYDLQQAVEIGL